MIESENVQKMESAGRKGDGRNDLKNVDKSYRAKLSITSNYLAFVAITLCDTKNNNKSKQQKIN